MPEPTTLAAQWAASVASRPSEVFLRFERSDVDPTGGPAIDEWTYAAFDALVERVARRFVSLDVGPARGVHLALRNSPSFIAAWVAATRLGSFIVPSDPMATAPELAEHLARTRPAVTIVAIERRATADEAIGMLDDGVAVPFLIEVDEDDPSPVALAPRPDDTTLPPLGEWPVPAPTDRAAIMFTSGTTGRPKGVEVTQANYAFAGSTMAAAAGLGPGDRQLVVLPMFHANAQYYSFASAIAVGASVALVHSFSASGFIGQAARHAATHASLFAGPLRMILARSGPLQPADGEPGLVLRHCWYAQNIGADQYETISRWFGCRPRQLYGMTETIPAVLTDCANDPQHDSMGFVTDGCSVEIHDRHGQVVDPGEVGEVVVGGTRGTTLFAGYLDDPDTTDRSFRDGWFLTGDRARRCADGRFFFDGRRSDVLKVSGENVSVVEVEAVLGEHPDVFEVVVVGAPDPIRDEVPVAFVVAVPGAHVGLEIRLAEWCGARLSKAKRPHRYVVVDELPRTSVGKIRKFLLTDAAATPCPEPDLDQQPHPDPDPTRSPQESLS